MLSFKQTGLAKETNKKEAYMKCFTISKIGLL